LFEHVQGKLIYSVKVTYKKATNEDTSMMEKYPS